MYIRGARSPKNFRSANDRCCNAMLAVNLRTSSIGFLLHPRKIANIIIAAPRYCEFRTFCAFNLLVRSIRVLDNKTPFWCLFTQNSKARVMVRVRGSIGVKLERGAGICVSAAHALPKHEMAPNDGESQPKTEGRRRAPVSWGPRSELRGDTSQRCGCEVSRA